MSSSDGHKFTHVALLPSAGMGHLTPFLRLAASLLVHNVQVSFITPHPTVSQAESQALSHLFASYPEIIQLQLNLIPLDKRHLISEDPFYYHFQVIQNSSHLLSPLLSSLSPPLSALITDMSLVSAVLLTTQVLNIPNYVFFTSSAKMFTLFVSFHSIVNSKGAEEDAIEIPNLGLIPKSWIPPPLLEEKDNFLKSYFVENGKKILESNRILLNTFESLEQETVRKLKDGKVIQGLPAVSAIGPLPPCDFEKNRLPLAWLDGQPTGTVVYVSFGSRTAMSREQVRELGDGLVRSGKKFLWVVKDKKVDRDDNEELSEIIGHELMERVKEKGLVLKHWINQEDVLSHPAVGGFLSHCGWNSVIEAIWHGVPILAWPQHGDQKINAATVESVGVGMWEKSWGWGGEMVVKGEDIGRKIKEMMENECLTVQTMHMREEARTAVSTGVSSNKGLAELIGIWKEA